jgi:hypothetical protein
LEAHDEAFGFACVAIDAWIAASTSLGQTGGSLGATIDPRESICGALGVRVGPGESICGALVVRSGPGKSTCGPLGLTIDPRESIRGTLVVRSASIGLNSRCIGVTIALLAMAIAREDALAAPLGVTIGQLVMPSAALAFAGAPAFAKSDARVTTRGPRGATIG